MIRIGERPATADRHAAWVPHFRDDHGWGRSPTFPAGWSPSTGEINYPAVAKALHEVGHTGVVGMGVCLRRQHGRA